MQTSDKEQTAIQKRLALMNELCELRPPPYWLEHALAFCSFHRLQLQELAKTIKAGRPALTFTELLQGQVQSDSNHLNIYLERAIKCGLLEPILQSIAECYTEKDNLWLERLENLQKAMEEGFPWLFLAFLGMRTSNIDLVIKCVSNFTWREARMNGYQVKGRHELGMAYKVWRYLFIREQPLHERLQESADNKSRCDWTFVHLAAAYGDQECLEFLLKQHRYQNHSIVADTATELEGFTSLHLAAWYGQTAIVDILLHHADQSEKNGPPPSDHIIAAKGPEDHSHQHNEGGKGNDKPIPIDRVLGRSPLHYAAFFGYKEIVERLVARWESRGVDLRDRFGITALHLSAFGINCHDQKDAHNQLGGAAHNQKDAHNQLEGAAHNQLEGAAHNEMLRDLIAKSKDPNMQVQHSVLQRAMISRFLIDRRNYVDSLYTSNSPRRLSLFNIPNPNILYSMRSWPIAPGFTVLHILANLANREGQLQFLLDSTDVNINKLDWAAIDFEGMTPIHYADSYPSLHEFVKKAAEYKTPSFKRPTTLSPCIAKKAADNTPSFKLRPTTLSPCIAKKAVDKTPSFKRPTTLSMYRQEVAGIIGRASLQFRRDARLTWVYVLDTSLLSVHYSEAHFVVRCADKIFENYFAEKFIGKNLSSDGQPIEVAEGLQLQVDDEVWDHLEWALDKALMQYTSSPEKYCYYNIGPSMQTSEVEEMVLSLVKAKQLSEMSTLQRRKLLEVTLGSSKRDGIGKGYARDVGQNGATGGRQKLWDDERKVYVDHVNTLLVAAALIAGLAFAGWLQPPRGFMQHEGMHTVALDMTDRPMRVFVWSGILAFSLGMGTMVAAAQGAMPYSIGTGHLMIARDRVQRATVVASVLLVGSIISLTISFSAAAVAIIPVTENPKEYCLRLRWALALDVILKQVGKRSLGFNQQQTTESNE
ncbi:hypothetical protein GOP47_0001877 [Adiantum capillus-veneris]|uniref:PGG domain-containing protein n=1 Tax=Adiantum capillus-veneris TaxID=13818 RepID=A0A9D4ZNP2_ADICA|nr:hypothetical protein GOP47_0001877 [Adiantum capillus-veneris]